MYKLITFIKKNKTILIIFSFSVILFCCKTAGTATSAKVDVLAPVNADVTAAQAHWSGTTLAQLNQGYALFSDKCTQCHEMKKPQDFTVDEWNNILPGMGRRAKLDSTQYSLVYHYVLAKRETLTAGK